MDEKHWEYKSSDQWMIKDMNTGEVLGIFDKRKDAVNFRRGLFFLKRTRNFSQPIKVEK